MPILNGTPKILSVLILSLTLIACGGSNGGDEEEETGGGSSGSSSSGGGSSSSSSSGGGSSSSSSSGGGSSSGGSSSGGGPMEPSTFILHGNNRVVGMVIDHATIDDRDGMDSTEFRTLTNEVYQHFNDAFDFIFFVSNNGGSTGAVNTAPYSGRYNSVSNNVSGIGLSLFDSTSSFGSDGKLQGVIHLTQHGNISGGPSLHEIMHRWGNFGNSTVQFSHWGFTSVGMDNGGQLGGFALSQFSDLTGGRFQASKNSSSSSFGTIANGGNGVAFGDLELYLMGIKSASSLSGFTINYFTDAVWEDQSNGIFTSAAGVKTLTFNDYQTELGGIRNPAFGSAQTEFSILTVLIDTALPNETDLAAIDQEVEGFSFAGNDVSSRFNFFEATGGLATVVMSNLNDHLK